MQRRGKERLAKFEKSPSLKPASLKFRFATLFPAEETGEDHRTALCHPAQSAGHSWESSGEGTKFSLRSCKFIFTHSTQQVGMV